ncbi:MAG TPA: hypothetical protein VFG31_07505, partial [Conexibacter sp.]|nr:hypothetical protein [Conexibacter sp.]
MATAGLGAPAAATSGTASAPHVHRSRLDLAAAAWLCALPCALAVAVVALLLGPPLGQLLTPAADGYTFLPDFARSVHPEPTEHARYLIVACAPFLLALAVATAPRWLARVPAGAVDPAVIAAQLVLVALVIASPGGIAMDINFT